jgi:hypothetical protein
LQKKLERTITYWGWWCNDRNRWLVFVDKESRCININVSS